MTKNVNGVMSFDKETIAQWTPALESFFGAELVGISSQKRDLMTMIASKAFENIEGFTAATENVGFISLNANNSQFAPNVANPQAGSHAGGVAQNGTSGSADPQFLVGLCLSLAAKTIGLELVQTIPASTQNITIDYLKAIYNGGDTTNTKNNRLFIVTAVFAVMPTLSKTQKYGFRTGNKIVLAKYIKTARDQKKGLIFELENVIQATIDAGTGAMTNVVYLTDENNAGALANAQLVTVDANLSVTADVKVSGVNVDITSVDNTKAIENYVPHQTSSGLKRTLGRKEADQGTERGLAMELKNEAYTIGNRVFNGHISRLDFKRLTEQGRSPMTFLTSSMMNEFAQEINYQIITAARAFGASNALNFEARGTSFNTFFGPSSVVSKPFSTISGANELTDYQGNAIASQFEDVPNLRLTMAYETIASLGAAIVMLIKQACYAIGTDSRYGDGDAAVVSSNIAGYIAACAEFTSLKESGSVMMDSKTGAKLSGTLGDIKIYVDVMIPESCPIITVLRTNKEVSVDIPGYETENVVIPGLAYLVKDIVSSIEIVPELTGGKKVIMDSETDLVAVGDNPERGYLTFAVDINIPGLTRG